jgi:hypothetical protein
MDLKILIGCEDVEWSSWSELMAVPIADRFCKSREVLNQLKNCQLLRSEVYSLCCAWFSIVT